MATATTLYSYRVGRSSPRRNAPSSACLFIDPERIGAQPRLAESEGVVGAQLDRLCKGFGQHIGVPPFVPVATAT